jgi:1,4-alpha-glucan branching enzyme
LNFGPNIPSNAPMLQDYQPIGGQHRYVTDQYGGGRTNANAVAAQRTWYAAGIAAAGLHMLFMGTEWAQTGWWHTDDHHRLQWAMAEDEIGQTMMRFIR